MTEIMTETGIGTGRGTETETEIVIVIETEIESLIKHHAAQSDGGDGPLLHRPLPTRGAADALKNGRDPTQIGF